MTQAKSFVIFAPNRLSAGDALIPADTSPDLFQYLREYFFGYKKGVSVAQPYTEAGQLMECLEVQDCDNRPLYESDSNTCVGSLHDYLENVSQNFGNESIVICSELD